MPRHPVNDLLALLGRRWALRVLYELRAGPLSYAELRRRCDEVSTSVLATRLRELVDEGLVDQREDGYELSADGAELGELLMALSAFARRRAG
jgi:DNA-binding HxlR family transcriptional regulator